MMTKEARLLRISIFLLFFFIVSFMGLSRTGDASEKSASRPNIVVIFIDALRPDKLGCYSFPGEISPEIDDLARKGVRFKTVITQSTWTRPSTGSILTSQYPRTLGIYQEVNESLNDRFVTLPEVLKANGYTTIAVTANPNINTVFNFHQGYDYYVDSNVVWEWMEAKRGQVQRSPVNKFKTAPEIFDTTLNILKIEKKRPFFVLLNIMDIHEKEQLTLQPEFSRLFSDYDRPEERLYCQMVRQVSKQTGDFVKKVLGREDSKNTLFVILSDHGEGLNDHPNVPNSTGHGQYLYDSNLKVPLILSHPESPLKSRVITQPVRLIDLMPTLLDYVGFEPPQNLVGLSLVSLINGTRDFLEPPRYFVAETQFHGNDKIAVYGARWKYIENRDGRHGLNRRELQRNGAREDGRMTDALEKHPEIARAMKRFLDEWEKRYPKAKPTPCKDDAAMAETLKQLKSLGYIK